MNDQKTTPYTRKQRFQRAYLNSAKRQTRINSSVINSERKEAVSRGFITIVYIVLFVLFSTVIGTIPQPTNVNTIQESQEYIETIAPEIGQASIGAIGVFFGLVEGVARSLEFLVTGLGSLVRGIFEFIGNPFGLLTNENADTLICNAWQELNVIQRSLYEVRYFFSGSDLDIQDWFIIERSLELGVDSTVVCQ